MPARLDLTPQQRLDREAARREQSRLGMARLRAERKTERAALAKPLANTADPLANAAPSSTHAGTSRSLGPKVTTTPPKTPTKSGEVIDRLRAEGFRGNLSPKDHAAIKRSDLSPAEIVEAFGAVSRGEWDNPWLRTNLSVEAVINRYSAFEALRRFPSPRTGGGRKSNGTRILEHLGYVAD